MFAKLRIYLQVVITYQSKAPAMIRTDIAEWSFWYKKVMYCCVNTQPYLHHSHTSSMLWKPFVSTPLPALATKLLASPLSTKMSFSSESMAINMMSVQEIPISAAATSTNYNVTSDNFGEDANNSAKGSGTTARGRRLLKVEEEKRKREYERLHTYPAWAKVLEDACKHDEELRHVLGDSLGNPELMRKRVQERVRRKGQDFSKYKTGSVLAFKVSFRDFNLQGSYIWFELLGSPTDSNVDLLGTVIQSWYVMGRLGAYNSSNLQLTDSSMEYNPLYDSVKGSKVMPSSFHDIGDVEFQDNWARVWVDLGTAEFFAIDILLNCLTVLSSDFLGIQQVVFGGRKIGDWEEGMTSADFGYKFFKI